MAKKLLIGAAVLLGVLVLLSRGGSLVDGADAVVDVELEDSVGLEDAREALATEATGSWQATRTAEHTDSDDMTMVEFTLPGPSLDGFIAALRRHPDAADVKVTLDVDADAVAPRTPEAVSRDATPETVSVQVNLHTPSGQGPLVTIVGALLVAVLAAAGLAMVWRRFGYEEPVADVRDGQRRWTNRP